MGGGVPAKKSRTASFPLALLADYISQDLCDSDLARFPKSAQFAFESHSSAEEARLLADQSSDIVVCSFSAPGIIRKMSGATLHNILMAHRVPVNRKSISIIRESLVSHVCDVHCSHYRFAFRRKVIGRTVAKRGPTKGVRPTPSQVARPLISTATAQDLPKTKFPPAPASSDLIETLVNGWCKDIHCDVIEERGCAVCGQLKSKADLRPLVSPEVDLSLLDPTRWGIQGVTRKERFSETDPVEELPGPVYDRLCSDICLDCFDCLGKRRLPSNALANGMWLGNPPNELKDLSFAERQLIARVRHSACLFRVKSGMYRMQANAIMYATPMPKIYKVLPPPREEMDDVLAFLYLGPSQPTNEELKGRIPLFVRRKKVSAALEWLKLNHVDYEDLTISQDNLDTYPEDEPLVTVSYYKTDGSTNREPEATAVYDDEEEEGVEEGVCPFVVHGITGEQLADLEFRKLKAQAMKHLNEGNKFLAIGRSNTPESLFKNPQLFPKMMPWLFQYGLGGVENGRGVKQIGAENWKKHQLMYHDKRFQTDTAYPIIAFNDEQIKKCTKGGMLFSESVRFSDTVRRLLSIEKKVLDDIVKRLEGGENVRPETAQEKMCYDIINDVDYVAGDVPGSLTGKKYMRNEIWSLMSCFGAPVWYITFSPADNKNPICLYYAGSDTEYRPDIDIGKNRYSLIANNPAAGARFFDLTVRLFLKHVLGVGTDHKGLYGDTSAYYGTVEQQGRLTLHLHLLLWIKDSLSPQEIRDRLLKPDSVFQRELVSYLESCHVGELATGTVDDVRAENKETRDSDPESYKDPTENLPSPAPLACTGRCGDCEACLLNCSWWSKARAVIDDLIIKSNIHKCAKRCLANKHGSCKARFPRDIVEETMVDPMDGSIKMKKLEAWINTVTPFLTYLLRCNTDVTGMRSGTSIKAVIGYITDYVTKVPLKTYAIFDVIRSVFETKQASLLDEDSRQEKARKLVTSIVNSLSAKLEIGSPMACMYLLKNPDHYTSHKLMLQEMSIKRQTPKA